MMELGPDVLLDLLATSLSYWWVIVPATLFGIVVGAIPGFNAANTIIILLPLTLAIDVQIGLMFMVSLYAATHLGGGIPAILVNIPGTGGAAATTLDGYPMAKQGRGQQALVLTFVASTLGGLVTSIATLFALPYLARMGYYVHSVEMVVIMLFGLTLIAVVAARDTLKGLIGGFFGLLLGAMGSDYIYATPRGTFGFLELYDGVPLIPALIGLFAISEAFVMIESETILTKQGRGQQALVLTFVASTLGGLVTSIATLFALPYLARMGYYVHSVEMVVIMLFGLTLIAVVAARDTLKGLIGGFFGLLLGAMGSDYIYATPRGTFGFLELYDGVPLIPALIGLFAISEAFVMIESETILTEQGRERMARASWADTWDGVRMALSRWWQIIWTAFIGLAIGVLPGAGASIAAFVAYQQSRFFSRTPELYGTGHPEGVIAPESANNGVTAGTLVPLLTLGIPGGSTAAVMLIVLQYHGVPLGPKLFIESPEMAYGVIMAMVVSYVFMIFTILPLALYMARVTTVPTKYLAPLIVSFTLVGAFVPREYLFDMGLALGFGIIGYIARKTGYHVAAILIGVILGPLVEQYYLRALRIAQGDPLVLFSSRLGNILWVLLLLSIALPYAMQWWRARRDGKEEIRHA